MSAREWQPGDVAILPRPGSINATSARRIAAIDPEDREQVERLSEMVADEIVRNGLKPRDAMQAALREYANPTPPKPEEPQGLGAVVESEDGRRWVRSKDTTTVCHWKPAAGGRRVRWSDLPAVRVLSEGVPTNG